MFHNKNPKSFVFNFWGSLHSGRLSFLSPFRGAGGLLLHQELHYHFGGVGNRGAGAEDGGNTGFVEEKRS